MPKWWLYSELAEFYNREADYLKYWYNNVGEIMSGDWDSIREYFGELNDFSSYFLYLQAFTHYLNDPFREEEAILFTSNSFEKNDSMLDIRDKWTVSKNVTLLLGVKFKEYTLNSKSLFGGKISTSSKNLYATATRQLGRKLTIGLSANQELNENDNYDTFNTTLEGIYRINPNMQIRCNYFNGQMAPDLALTDRREVVFGTVINTEILNSNDLDLTGQNIQTWNYQFGDDTIGPDTFETFALGFSYLLRSFQFTSRFFKERHGLGISNNEILIAELKGVEFDTSFNLMKKTRIMTTLFLSDLQSLGEFQDQFHINFGGSITATHKVSEDVNIGASYIGNHKHGGTGTDDWRINISKSIPFSTNVEVRLGLKVGYYTASGEWGLFPLNDGYNAAFNARFNF